MQQQQQSERSTRSNAGHWFLREELKWRSVASAVWTWCITFSVLAVFIILFSFHPARHIFIIYDVLNTISTLRSWLICTFLATLTALLVRLHLNYYSVSPSSPVTRLGFIAQTIQPSKIFHNMMCGVFGGILAHLVTYLVNGRYSFSYLPCTYNTEDGIISKLCLNESWFIMVLFGFVLGVAHSMNYFLKQKNTLLYLHVQEARFLFIKCKLPCMISNCTYGSFSFLRKFFIVYYLVGFVARDAVAFIFGVLPSEQYLLSIWRIFNSLPVLWNLWLLGTLFLLLWELSWQLFNIYNTQNFAFLLDSVFPEDTPKLLLENLGDENPPTVQYLAYQCLSLISKESSTKRQQIFALSHQTENGRPLSWNKVVDNCLLKIRQFTEELSEHQLVMSAYAGGRHHSGKSTSSTSSNPSDESKSEPSPASVSVYRRRPLADMQTTTFGDSTNISCFNMSSLNATHLGQGSAHTTLNSSHIAVPTPRLWTSTANAQNDMDSSLLTGPGYKTEIITPKMVKSRFQKFILNLKALPIIAYFLAVIPNCALLNLYRHQLIHKWTMQSLSYLCAASIAEDKFGVVQTRLREIIASLVDLLVALEKVGKVSGTTTQIQRLRTSLCQEVKSSLHRITDAFGESLKSVNLAQEHRRRVESIMIYSE